jgi:hypothetical protein
MPIAVSSPVLASMFAIPCIAFPNPGAVCHRPGGDLRAIRPSFRDPDAPFRDLRFGLPTRWRRMKIHLMSMTTHWR